MISRWRENLRLRSVAFVLGNVAALAAIFWLIVIPIQSVSADRDIQIAEQRTLHARLNAFAAQAATVKDFAGRAEMEKDRVEFLQGTNEGVVAANLQGLLKGMVQSSGARLRSVRTLPATADSGEKLLGAQVDITGPIRAIWQIVQSVETTKPYLFIINATLKPSIQTAAQSASGLIEPTIDAQLDIVGAMQNGGRE